MLTIWHTTRFVTCVVLPSTCRLIAHFTHEKDIDIHTKNTISSIAFITFTLALCTYLVAHFQLSRSPVEQHIERRKSTPFITSLSLISPNTTSNHSLSSSIHFIVTNVLCSTNSSRRAHAVSSMPKLYIPIYATKRKPK